MKQLLDFPGPGIDYDMPAETYHRIKALSQSGSRPLMRSGLHWELAQADDDDKVNKARQIGKATHIALLEPEHFTFEVVRSQKFDRRHKDQKAAAQKFDKDNADKIILDPDMFDTVWNCADAIRNHPVAGRVLKGAKTEVSLFWEDERTGVPCKARLDIVSDVCIADPKTTDDASAGAFSRHAASMRYHVQAAHYSNGWERLTGESLPYWLIPVEKEPPYGVNVFELDPDTMEAGQTYINRAADYFAAMLAKPGQCYSPEIKTLILPNWIKYD